MIAFERLDPTRDEARAIDLFARAADYVRLETGADDTEGYAREMLVEAPPGAEIFNYGLARRDGKLAGFAGSVRGYPGPRDWYMGLLVLDPAERGSGLGTTAFTFIRELARSHDAPAMRIAVLDANPAGRRFWERQGFVLERSVPGDPEGDGHLRHVLKLDLEGA
ncbi:GNAT family N-acetyltransferase [Roseobacter sp. HKCCA0434]|uniref:GNAT family N-acetyltransferase n=1 Tax=Roseobacter sp. HKCCA0434 TaxID=3079297 RepID=UPI002905D42E|nr:GNAT family N-acetyltransferase [Roseobacter sp. HKCCA0434]